MAKNGDSDLATSGDFFMATDTWPGCQECRDCQQHADVPDPAAVPVRRLVLISTLPAGLRQFAEYQPFTPVIQTIRGLLTGGPIGAHAIAAVAWSAGIALACYLWSIRLYDRRRAADPK